MKYQREEDPKILAQIEPHLIFSTEQSKLNFLRVVIEWMQSQPGSIFVYTAKEDDNTLRGFFIGQAVRNENHVWIAQAWSDPVNSREVADEFLHRARLWTIAIGRKFMRAETKRKAETFSRRFEFKPIATIIEHVIPDDLIERFCHG